MPRGKKSQADLPGMENRRLDDLHEKAIELEAVRSQRMELTQRETALADEVRILMEKYDKQESGYKIDGVEVEYLPPDGKPKIKVRVEKESDDETKPGEVTETTEVIPTEGQAESTSSGKSVSNAMKAYWDKRRKEAAAKEGSVQ